MTFSLSKYTLRRHLFSLRNGTAVVATDTNMKHMGINIDYYSKGTLMMETHSSFILPKESPLVVSLHSLKFCTRT